MEKSSKFKISFNEEPQFFIDEKRKTVVCKMIGLLRGPFADYWGGEVSLKELYEEIEGVAVAKCSEKDTFDINRGKRIALAKAENTIYKLARNFLTERITEIYTSILRKTAEFSQKSDWCINHNKFYIDKLSNENNPEYVKEVLPPKRGTEVKHI